MTYPLPVYDGTNAQVIFDLIAKVLVDTGGRSIRLLGPFSAAVPNLAAGATGSTAYSHGLNIAAPVVVGHLQNGTFIEATSWAATITSANVVTFWFRNNGGSALVGGTLKFFILG